MNRLKEWILKLLSCRLMRFLIHNSSFDTIKGMEGKDLINQKIEGGLRTRGEFHKKSEHGKPLVSIITVVRNGEKYLEQTIQSVLNQTYENIEYIIVDGASTDGTLNIVRKYENKIAYWVSEPDGGIYDAMNKGIQFSIGEIIGIINSDDWYELDAVQNILDVFVQEKADVVYGNSMIVSCGTTLARLYMPNVELMKKNGTINHPTIFVRSCLYKQNLFNLNYDFVADYDLFIKLMESNYVFKYCNKLIAYIRTGGASSSVLAVIERYKVQKKYFGLSHVVGPFFTRCFFSFRRNAIKLIFSSSMYEAIRRRWWIHKGYIDSKRK